MKRKHFVRIVGVELKHRLYAHHTFSVDHQCFEIKEIKSIQLMTTIWTEPNMKIITIMKSSYVAKVYVSYRLKLDTVIGINESNRISNILKISSGDSVRFIIIVWMWQHLLVTPSLLL